MELQKAGGLYQAWLSCILEHNVCRMGESAPRARGGGGGGGGQQEFATDLHCAGTMSVSKMMHMKTGEIGLMDSMQGCTVCIIIIYICDDVKKRLKPGGSVQGHED